MRILKIIWVIGSSLCMLATSCEEEMKKKEGEVDQMMIRIAELEIDEPYLDEYIAILKEEAAASVKLEKGVLCIYPMFQKEKPTEIRLLEIYKDENAYKAHLQTPHFLHYKSATQEMVKSLKLIDMEAIDPESMQRIFEKY